MECPNGCMMPMQERKVEKMFHRNGDPVVVSELLMYVCSECNQEAMPLESARIVEDILNCKRNASGKFTAELYKVG